MSPEFQLIAALARRAPTEAHRARAHVLCSGPLDWDRLSLLAGEHRVAPLFATNALTLDLPRVGHDIQDNLRQLRRTAVAAELRRFRHWLAVMQALTDRGIRAVTLRGFPMVLAVYGKVGVRQIPKLDVLIERSDLDRARAVLAGYGYRTVRPTFTTDQSAVLDSPGGRLALHWQTGALSAGAEPLLVEGQTVLVPPCFAALALLLSHGHATSWDRLASLVDVAESVDRLESPDARALVDHLDRTGARPALDDALARIQRLWGQPTSPGLAALARPSRRPRPAAPLTFVSAIYDSNPTSLLGGRGRSIDDYLPSLINIGRMGAPLVLFCAPHDVDRVEREISPYFCECRVVAYELQQFPFFKDFIAWKRTYRDSLLINDRNEVLCFLKSWWVQRAIADDPFGPDQYFWIDAGLTHHGLFPERIGGVELGVEHPDSHYHPHNPANIFSPALAAAVAQSARPGALWCCAKPFDHVARRRAYEHAVAPLATSPDGVVTITDHLVGGLFGGHAHDVTRVHEAYVAVLERLIATRTYALEEQVFSCVHAMHPTWFSLQRFETWQFFDPGARTSRLPAEGASFYKIFTRLLGGHPERIGS